MSSSENLADKLARLIESEMKTSDVASLFASIEKINHRLRKLEAATEVPSSTSDLAKPHPSLQKFSVAEAVADEIFASLQKEKACTFEPNGKPCDHCSMCSSRGF